ncbi:MAG: hypothetical protein ACI9LO_001500 [Planctomycetota bacterium]|jgi:hypothetical protein
MLCRNVGPSHPWALRSAAPHRFIHEKYGLEKITPNRSIDFRSDRHFNHFFSLSLRRLRGSPSRNLPLA